jgi:hypothetical protein
VGKLIAILACVALSGGNELLPLLHVHDYGDHDHPTHDHGPAFHGHGHGAVDDDEPAGPSPRARVAPCEPDAHVVSLRAVAATPTPLSVHILASPVAPFLVRQVSAPPLERRDEVRSHSPPGLTDSPLRAPPLSRPA